MHDPFIIFLFSPKNNFRSLKRQSTLLKLRFEFLFILIVGRIYIACFAMSITATLSILTQIEFELGRFF